MVANVIAEPARRVGLLVGAVNEAPTAHDQLVASEDEEERCSSELSAFGWPMLVALDPS
jgi:hypothetical protein